MARFADAESGLIHTLRSLVEVDYEVADAYTAALSKIIDKTRRTALEEFRSDHLRHVYELGRELMVLGQEPPFESASKSAWLAGKVVLGDKGILKVLRSVEKNTQRSCERALESVDLSGTVGRLLCENLADERRHLSWLEDQLASLEELDEDQRITPRELPR